MSTSSVPATALAIVRGVFHGVWSVTWTTSVAKTPGIATVSVAAPHAVVCNCASTTTVLTSNLLPDTFHLKKSPAAADVTLKSLATIFRCLILNQFMWFACYG